MNANELADAMEIRASIRRKATSRKSVTEGANDRLADQLDQAAIMIREQQALIEALKYEKSSGVYDIEPVAHFYPEGDGCTVFSSDFVFKYHGTKAPIALYTHPVKEQLTDEVKDALMDALSGWKYIRHSHGDLYGVGWDRVQNKLEEILRKAQEK